MIKKLLKKKTIYAELATIENEIRKSPNTSTYYDILLIFINLLQANDQTNFDSETVGEGEVGDT